MSHYFLEGLDAQWSLVRETPSSMKLRARTSDGYDFAVDIHFTQAKILTVNICFVGGWDVVSKAKLNPIMDDISKIALRRCDYSVIDYTLSCTEKLSDGNYSIDKRLRDSFAHTM